MKIPKAVVLVILIAFPAILRVTDHPWNFAAVGAMALFVGAYFREKSWALIVPIAAMFLSDLAMGWHKNDWNYAFHDLLPIIYACFLINVCLGFGMRRIWKNGNPAAEKSGLPKRTSWVWKIATVPVACLLGSLIFFGVTNFAVWAIFPTYPHTAEGLLACYEAGIPYFRTSLTSDLVFAAILFGGYELLRHRVPAFSESTLLYVE